MMRTTDLLLLTYAAFDGVVKGSTNLQKKIYFLSIMLNIDLGYNAHYYGPYSSPVAASNRELKSLGYLRESVASVGAYNAQGFEVARHDFELTEDGWIVARIAQRQYPDLWKRLQEAAVGLQAAGDLNYVELSLAAKSYFLLANKGAAAHSTELVAMARRFGWSVTEEEIEKAITFLERLDLATRN